MITGARILITGATGQIGGDFADDLAPRNEVWAIARYSRPGSRERLESIGVKTVAGDFAEGDFGGLPDDFDYVLHFAANTKPGVAEVGMVQNAEGTGLLMHHCRKAKAFLHVSTCGVYTDHADRTKKKVETDDVGGATPHSPNYGPTKTAAEGVARTMARLYELPTTIARINCGYGGPHDDGGLPGMNLDALIAGRPIRLPKTYRVMESPVHTDDMLSHLQPLLNAASVPAIVVNWGGGEGVAVEDWCRYMAELIGVEPVFDFTDESALPHTITDTERGRSIGMTWKVGWREGMRRMIQARHPEIRLRDTGPA